MNILLRLGCLRSAWRAQHGESEGAVDDLLACLRAVHLYKESSSKLGNIGEFAYANIWEARILTYIGIDAQLLDRKNRQRFAIVMRDLPDSISLDEVVANDCLMSVDRVRRLRMKPIKERSDQQNDAMCTDANLDDFIATFPFEAAYWHAYLRKPLSERIQPLSPPFTTGETHPNPLIMNVAPTVRMLSQTEVQLAIRREQSIAALAYIDDGEVALTNYPDPVTGKPFRAEKTNVGFRLLCEVPGFRKPCVLVVGEIPKNNRDADNQNPNERQAYPEFTETN